jgi:predicted nucleic acid-binding protein
MIVYSDANILIYLIEQPPLWGPRAAARYASLRAANDEVVVSDLARLECRVGPLQTGNMKLLAQFDAFFAAPDVRVVPLNAAVCERAAQVRATYRFKALDSLHLAAAIVHGCDRFLTNDTRLSACTDIVVEVLP